MRPNILITLFLALWNHSLIHADIPPIIPAQTVAAAREQIGVTVSYDPSYRKIGYPNGDVPIDTGVCADVIVRALRKQNADLQQLAPMENHPMALRSSSII